MSSAKESWTKLLPVSNQFGIWTICDLDNLGFGIWTMSSTEQSETKSLPVSNQ